ncbi:DUF4265 domain-containing protein [Myxococcaceae bacterium GXIMD 01537]
MSGSPHGTAGDGWVKVTFPLEEGAWHGAATERLWAEPVSEDRYQLRNSPFYAFGVSTEDVVFAQMRDGMLTFSGVAQPGGHSTYRLIKNPGASGQLFSECWEPLRARGCTFEEGPGRLLSVDVVPEANIHEIYGLLEQGEARQAWHFEEGHCGHALDAG